MSDKNNLIRKKDIPELSLKKNILGRWADFFIDRFRITILLIVGLLLWGGMNGLSMQREANPEVTIPWVSVVTTYTGASPEEIETMISEPIEKKLKELDDVKKVYSTSMMGVSIVEMELESGVDIMEKVREARDMVSDVSLPEDADSPEVSDYKTGETPLIVFSVSGDDDILVLQEYAKNIKDALEDVDDVSDVAVIGDLDREIEVTVDPQKLSLYGISLQEINNALSYSNVNMPGGNVELGNKRYNIRTVGRFGQIEQILNTIVRSTPDGNVYLKDIAEVDNGYEEQEIHVRRYLKTEGRKEFKNALAISVKKKSTADIIKVRDSILKMMEEKGSRLYPDNIQVEIVSDMANEVDKQLGSVSKNALSGLCLVVVVLFLFIGFKESIIVSFVIPLSLCMAFGIMKAYGMTFNQITMFSLILAVGMLVDNAIVIMENIDRLRNEGLTASSAAKTATNQIAPAVMASALTTIASFFPILLTSGIIGDYIRGIPLTVIFALGSSFFIAMTITPSISALILKKHKKNKKEALETGRGFKIFSVILVTVLSMMAFMNWDNPGLSKITILSYAAGIIFGGGMFVKQFANKKTTHEDHPVIQKYSVFLRWIIESNFRKGTVMGVIILCFMLSVALIPMGLLKVEMFGGEDMEGMYVYISTPQGSTLNDTMSIQKEVEDRISGIPEIKGLMSYIGTEGTDIWSDFELEMGGTPNRGRIIVELVPYSERELTSTEIAEQIRERIKGIPGGEVSVTEWTSGPPSGTPVYIKLLGEDMEMLENTAKDFKNILKNIPGSKNVELSIGTGAPELVVKVDKTKAAGFGLDDMSIAMSIRNATNGIKATTFRENQDEYDIIIRTAGNKLSTVNDIDNIYFYNHMGYAVPFSQVAEVVEDESAMTITHEDGERRIGISAEVKGGITANEIIREFNEQVKNCNIPEGVTYTFGGEDETMEESFSEMMVNMVVALLLVFLILSVQFNSLSQPLIIMFSMPMALIGVMPGLVVTGNNFGFLAFVGLVALVGIVVNDAIVLVDYINYLRKSGFDMKDAIVKTGKTRFIPVLATTITTAGGILPITLEDAFFSQLGVTIIFGLCMATVLTLIVVPTLYSIVEGIKDKRRNRAAVENSESSDEMEALMI